MELVLETDSRWQGKCYKIFYQLNVFIPPKFICLNLNPQVMVLVVGDFEVMRSWG